MASHNPIETMTFILAGYGSNAAVEFVKMSKTVE